MAQETVSLSSRGCSKKHHLSEAISNFVHDITSSDVYNKLNQSPTADPNVNYNMLHDVIKLAKDKHMPYKTVKFNKYKHKKNYMDNASYT